jgi:hypothetical protein
MSTEERIDFGGGVVGYWLDWSPDRSIPSNAQRYQGIADIPRSTLVLEHAHRVYGTPCEGHVSPDVPNAREVFGPDRPLWQVQSWEPLTLTPSVLCSCGWHGYITNGRWVNC